MGNFGQQVWLVKVCEGLYQMLYLGLEKLNTNLLPYLEHNAISLLLLEEHQVWTFPLRIPTAEQGVLVEKFAHAFLEACSEGEEGNYSWMDLTYLEIWEQEQQEQSPLAWYFP